MGSKPFSLSGDDALRIFKGFGIALAGFVAAYITTSIIPALQADGTSLVNMALVAVLSVAANALRLFMTDTR